MLRKPGLSRVLAPVALAASLILGMNLASNQAFAEGGGAKRAGASPEARPAPATANPAKNSAAPVLTESQKIDRLIAYIGALQGAVFIRNGDEHTPAEAVAHLQMKREKAGDRVKTADDFIRLCASRSYLSGKPYEIRFADGRMRTSEDVLREALARLNAGG